MNSEDHIRALINTIWVTIWTPGPYITTCDGILPNCINGGIVTYKLGINCVVASRLNYSLL